MLYLFNRITIFIILVFLPLPALARCAVCYTNGLSGASIAVIVIILSGFFLFFANKFLQSFLNK
tara:strand:+ start:105 stop:296 length:192 start_codon:yes stop_codon:yes gene_type:complete